MIAERIVGTKADLRVPDSNGAIFPKAAIRSSKFNDCLVRILPVRAPRSERRCFPNRPLVISAAKGGEEPRLTDAAGRLNARYHESDQKPSTTTFVLNGVYGSVNRGVLRLYQKRRFLVHFLIVGVRTGPPSMSAVALMSDGTP